jgi:hypothetical protein
LDTIILSGRRWLLCLSNKLRAACNPSSACCMLLLLVLVTASGRGDCDQDDETCEWDQADQPATAAARQSSPAKPADDQCERWADAGECKANAAYMKAECAKACRRAAWGKPPSGLPTPPTPPQPETPDKDAHCGLWANKGECEKNVDFMAAKCQQACRRHADELKDKDPRCGEWAAQGDCDTDPSKKAKCRTACLHALEDSLDAGACAALVARGECGTAAGLVQCRSSCLAALQLRLSPDTEGNCWYWGTDGECAHNSIWMRKTCPRTCVKLEACRADGETASSDEGPPSHLRVRAATARPKAYKPNPNANPRPNQARTARYARRPSSVPWPMTSGRTARTARGAASAALARGGPPRPSRAPVCSPATCSTLSRSRTPSRARRRRAAPGSTRRLSSRRGIAMAPHAVAWATLRQRC